MMAFIRVRGNYEGIVFYLKSGIKSGRTQGRDELDERIPLKGDIDLLDEIINTISSQRKKYTHITISFKEDDVTPAMMRKAVDYYEKHIFRAFRSDEYYLYAEAHMPKRNSLLTESGDLKYNKPHIHIVVPNVNLKTGKSLNPWGGIYMHHERFHNAIQEGVSMITGSVSPSQSRRPNFDMRSTIYEKDKDDVFAGNNVTLKQSILDKIINDGVSSIEALREVLLTFGESKTVNRGKNNEYEAVKPVGEQKFTHLRHFVFSKDFLKLTGTQKKQFLCSEEDERFLSLGDPQSVPEEIEKNLIEWHHLRSKQIKYIDKNVPTAYKMLEKNEKIEFLKNLELEYYRKLDALPRAEPDLPPLVELKETRRLRILVQPEPSSRTGRRNDTLIAQLVRDETALNSKDALKAKEFVKIWNDEIDIAFMLADLSFSRGLVRKKYKISGDELPHEPPIEGQRIRCGKHNLRVVDFLTRQMRMSFPEAFAYMKHICAKQKTHFANLNPRCGHPDNTIWRQFRAELGQTKISLNAEYVQFMTKLKETTRGAYVDAALQRSFDRFTMFQIKMPDYVRKLLLNLIDVGYLERRPQTTSSKKVMEDAGGFNIRLSNWSLYLSFLHRNAIAAPTHLEELRKHSPARPKHGQSLYLIGSRDEVAVGVTLAAALRLTVTVKENGDAIYERNGIEYVRDEGAHMIVNAAAGMPAIEAAFRLASKKWKRYGIDGQREQQLIAMNLASSKPELAQGLVRNRSKVLTEDEMAIRDQSNFDNSPRANSTVQGRRPK
jgi:hypothetical protein